MFKMCRGKIGTFKRLIKGSGLEKIYNQFEEVTGLKISLGNHKALTK
jgi:hypothetical protein